ncbi:hypothetical protein [Janthinobacterium sp. UMAB-60]|uniref:hypothetical protein n=1 Tax=Janthinobacterium sp. UMAB-60 TaxID=1365365 RepID=UPI001C55D198|nr:hypothetical protein [Janthinobacterium sp. UMAB-60]
MTEMEQEIISFFEKYIDDFLGDMGVGGHANHPDFELLPRDFVEFAERDLKAGSSTHSLVNATANLKRAVDCQLDYLLVALNLDKLYREKRLGVDRKLGFLKRAGIFRSRSIEKLNTFRNRLEHHYEIPKIEDVEVYFDLVAAFVSVAEAVIPAFSHSASLGMQIHGGGYVGTKFTYEGPKLELSLRHDATNYDQVFQVDLSESMNVIDKLESFAFLLRVHLLFRKYDESAIGPRHFLSSLRGDTQI